MKRIIYLCTLITFLAAVVYAGDTKREFNISRGGNLIIDAEVGGEIYIRGWDKDKAEIKAEPYRLDSEDYEINYDANPSRLKIEISKKRGWRGREEGNIDLTIAVPSECNVDVETVGGSVNIKEIKGKIDGRTAGGSLHFADINGDIEFQTMGGAISAEKIDGHLDLNTMGGSISVSDSRADGTVKTMGGSVLIENVKGNIDGSTMGGSVKYNNVSGGSSDASSEGLRISSMGGSIAVDDAPNGADLETKGGSIKVNKAKEYVKAETMGGSIVLHEIDGRIDASTMGGSVTAKMVGDPDKGDREVYISSKSGDIDLTVPRGLSMDFDIELAYTKNADRNYDIYSDFDIKKERTKEWYEHWGTDRKFIYGTGEYKGGKNKIKIETINGDVHIREGSD